MKCLNKTVASVPNQQRSTRKYSPEELQIILTNVKQAYDVGLLDTSDIERFMNNFKFRDEEKRYWTIGFQSKKWYYYSGQGWVVWNNPMSRLEALSDLSLSSIPLSKGRAPIVDTSKTTNARPPKLTPPPPPKDLTASEETKNLPPPPPPL